MTNFKSWLKGNYPYLVGLGLLVFVAYFNSLNNAFVADDIPGILNKENITEIGYIFATPLVLVRTFLNFTIANIFGRSPTAFRTVNILFHLGNVWLLYLLLYILADRKTALFAAAILAVHPLLTESVTWVAGGLYTQYSLYILLGLVLYILSDEKGSKKLYWGSMISFTLALLTSEKAMAFPFILAALEFAYKGLQKNWKRLIPPFVLGGAWILFFVSKIGERISILQSTYYQTPQTNDALAQIPIAIAAYLKLIFWPQDLTLYHSEMSFSAIKFYLHITGCLVFLGLLVWAYYLPAGKLQGAERRHKKNKLAFFWLSFFVIALAPTLAPFGVSWIVAERYVYLGAIGIFAVVAMGIQKIGEKFDNPNISYAILIPVLLALTTLTIIRNTDWKNQDTLWLAAAKTSPSSPQNHNNLGDMYGRWGDLERSAAEFKKAIELKPGYADAYHNLANTYQQMGRIEEAIENYQKAIEFNPNLWQSYQNLAAIYFEQERFELAREWTEKLEIIYQKLAPEGNSKSDRE